MMSDKKRLMGYYSTDNKNSLLYDLKRLFKDLYSFARNLISHPKPCQIRVTQYSQRKMGSVPILLTFLTIILVFISFALYLPKAQSSGIFLNQTDWSGGAREGMVATESDWLNYDSADAEIDVSQAGDITLALIEGLFEDTTSDHFKEGTLDETLVISDGGISLSHPVRLNEYTVGALANISVTASSAEGSGPWTISFNNRPNLSRIFKSDKFKDASGKSFKILSVSDAKDTIVVIDSEGSLSAPAPGSGTVGRWFSSLTAWEDARDGSGDADITASGRNAIERALCYYDGEPDTSNLMIDGWTTDAAHYIEIYVPASERHTGRWTSSAYTLSTTAKAPNIFVREDHTRIHGLQIESKATDSHYAISLIGEDIQIARNIIKGTNDDSLQNWNLGILIANQSTAKIYNNIIYHLKSANARGRGIVGGGAESTIYVYNNTIYGCDIGIDQGAGGLLVARNNISYNNGNNYHGTFDPASRGNLSGPRERGAPGLNPRDGAFVDFIDEDAQDFHLNALDSTAKDGGADLSLDAYIAFTRDIDGEARAGKWDIGADEAGLSAVVTHSIGTNGRDFATLQAWEDARDGDLTKRHIFRVSKSSGAFTDGETVTNDSGASGVYVKERDEPGAGERFMTLDDISGTFTTGNVMSGAISGSSATLDAALAVSGVIERGEAHADDVFTDGVVIKGSTTNADHYMILTAARRSRHTGRAGTGVIIDMQGKKAGAITVDDDYARVEGLEVTGWAGAYAAVQVNSGAKDVVVLYNILHDNDSDGTKTGETPVAIDLSNDTGLMRAANNIIYNISNKNGRKGAGIVALTSTATKIEGNIIYNAAGAGIDTTLSSAVIVENNAAVGNGRDFTGKYAVSSAHNISSDETAPGARALTNKTVADIAFVSTADGAEDFRTMIGSAAREITTALSLDGSDAAIARLARYAQAPHAGDDAWFPNFAQGYNKAGAFTSRAYDTQARPFYKTLIWGADVPAGSSLVIRVRSGNQPKMIDEIEWKDCPILLTNEHMDIERLSSVTDGARYVQYRAEFISDDGDVTPTFEDVSVTYEGYPLDAKELISSAFNTGMKKNMIARLIWEETVHEGTDGVGIQMRSAPDNKGVPGVWSDWLGPKGESDLYIDVSGSEKINALHQDGLNDQWVQYKVRLFTSGLSVSLISDITIDFSDSSVEGPTLVVPVPEPEPESTVDDTEEYTDQEKSAIVKAVDKIARASKKTGEEGYGMLIKIGDRASPDPEDENILYKDGDVIIVKPEDHLWGAMEKVEFLIVNINSLPDRAKKMDRVKRRLTGTRDRHGRWEKKVMRRRSYKLDLSKLGVDYEKISDMPLAKREFLADTLKGKILSSTVIKYKAKKNAKK